MAAYQQNKLLNQFSIKFFTELEFENLKEPHLRLPGIDYEKKIHIDNAIGRVNYNNCENGIFITWDEIKPNTMAYSLGYNILVHDDTSQAIFLSLIRYLQNKFKQEIIFDESFTLARIDTLEYSKCKKIICPIIMKSHQNKNIKRIYGGIIVPLVNYIVMLKPKIDVTLLNNFYNIDEEHLQQDVAPMAASSTMNNLTSIIQHQQQSLISQSKTHPNVTFVRGLANAKNVHGGGGGGGSGGDDDDDDDDSESDEEEYGDCNALNKNISQNLTDSKVLPTNKSTTPDESKTLIENVTPHAIGDQNDHTDSNCGCYACNATGVERRKRRKHGATKKSKKKFDFEMGASDIDCTTTTSYDATSSGNSDDENSLDEEPKFKKIKSTSSSMHSRSTLSKFNAKFQTLAIEDNSIIAHLTDLYTTYLDPLNKTFEPQPSTTDLEVFEVLFGRYKNANNISEDDLNTAMIKIYQSYLPEQTQENFEQLLSSARINGKDGILLLYSYIMYYIQKID